MSGSAMILPIGMIHPPPDIRTIVEKTANFVAKNGQEFEHRIRNNNASNSRYDFLKSLDRYNAYYKHCLSHFLSQTSTTQQPTQASDASGGEI